MIWQGTVTAPGLHLRQHDLADVIAADGRLEGRVCQACGTFREGPVVLVHPKHAEAAEALAFDIPVYIDPLAPYGSAVTIDESSIPDPNGCSADQ